MTAPLHPLYGTITQVLTRRPAPNFADGITSSAHLGAPDYARTNQQHAHYVQALRATGVTVTVLDADERFPDGHFIEDTLVPFEDCALVCRSAAPARQGETETVLPYAAGLRLFTLDDDAAFIDGGDVLICADRVLVGLSSRTNHAGAQALRRMIHSRRPDVRVDSVPIANVLHLKTGLAELAPSVLLRSPALHIDYDLSWAQVITLPSEEGYAANALPINDTLLIAEGYPSVRAAAERHCAQIIEVPMSEFRKMDGGLSCLSLRW